MTAPEAKSLPPARYRRTIVWVAIGAAAIDATSKIVGSWFLVDGPVEWGPVSLRLVHNSGFAFGLGADAPAWIIVTATTLVTALIVAMIWRGTFGGVAAGLVIGGAAANVADRALGGSVVDLIDVGAWPTFNLADTFIVIGFGLLLLGERRRSDVR